jgi:alpha-1,2-mannosyltransferase
MASVPSQSRAGRYGRCLVWLASFLALVLFARSVGVHTGFDARIYAGAIGAWVHGGDLYGWGIGGSRNLGFTYPPFAALVLAPIALFPLQAAVYYMATASVACLSGALRSCSGVVAPGGGLSRGFVVGAVTALIVTTPFRDTLGFGQINIVLAALIVVDMHGVRVGRRWSGALVGLAAAIKLTPGIFILFLLTRRDTRRSAVVAIATGGLATLGAAAVAPSTSGQYWFHELWATGRVGSVDSATNQALSGVLARGASSALLPVGSVLILVAGLTFARRAWRTDWIGAVLVIGITGTLVSPISWMHHLVWQSAAAVLLVARCMRQGGWRSWRCAAAVACYGVLVTAVPDMVRRPAGHHLDAGMLTILGENSFALVSLLLLALMWAAVSRQEAAPVAPAPTPLKRGYAPKGVRI